MVRIGGTGIFPQACRCPQRLWCSDWILQSRRHLEVTDSYWVGLLGGREYGERSQLLCFIKVGKDWERRRPGAFQRCSGGHTHLVINEGLYKTGRPRMTDTLLAWMSWKGRRILGRNEGEREHYNFLEHEGARQLGDQRHWLREDLACDWCGLTDPAFFLGKDLSYWNWDQGETACGGWWLGWI